MSECRDELRSPQDIFAKDLASEIWAGGVSISPCVLGQDIKTSDPSQSWLIGSPRSESGVSVKLGEKTLHEWKNPSGEEEHEEQHPLPLLRVLFSNGQSSTLSTVLTFSMIWSQLANERHFHVVWFAHTIWPDRGCFSCSSSREEFFPLSLIIKGHLVGGQKKRSVKLPSRPVPMTPWASVAPRWSL
jgi:hypothetical protein